jgi:hypothetical protein
VAEKRPTPRKNAGKSSPRSSAPKRPAKDQAPPAAVASPTPVPVAAPQPVAAPRWTLGGALILVVVLLAIAVTVVVGLRMRGDGREAFQLELGVPTAASTNDLRAFASPSRPVYWIGPANSGSLEVTRTSGGAVYVRYLPAGVAVGDKAPSYTTIATYSMPDAYASMQRSAKARGFAEAQAANGGLAVWRVSRATSVYLAFPKTDYLVEIYDPSPRRARSLALSARVRPVP